MTKEIQTLENSGVATIEAYAANLEKKMQMCKVLRESGFAPVSFKTDGAVLAAILYGQELGFSPIQSLQSIDVIQGKPTVNAQGMKAKIYQCGGIVTEIAWTDKVCSLEGTRNSHKQVATYTIEDARLAGLTGKDNWKRMPKAMLYARAVTMLARNQWADVIKGLCGAEEMQDAVMEVLPAEQIQPVLAAIPNLVTADQLELKAHDHNERLGFGKHKDETWGKVNQQYLEWLLNKGDPKISPRALAEIDRRAASQEMPAIWGDDNIEFNETEAA